MSDNGLKLKKFKPDDMKIDRTIMIVGKTGTGKTTVMYQLLYHLREKFDIVIAMTPTHDVYEVFKTIIPESFVFNDFDSEKVDQLVKLAEDLIECKKERTILLCVDDCTFDKKSNAGKTMRKLAMNGRHLKICKMECTQYLMEIPSTIRGQIGYVFSLKEPIINNRKRLYDHLFGNFPTFKSFDKVHQQCTMNHEMLVLDNTNPSCKVQDNTYWYKCSKMEDIPRFRMCRPCFWTLSRQYHVKEMSSEDRVKLLLNRAKSTSSNIPNRKNSIDNVQKLD